MNLQRDKLLNILFDLTNHKNNDKIQLMNKYVKDKLQLSLQNYYKEMFANLEALMSFNCVKVMKKLNKEIKNGN